LMAQLSTDVLGRFIESHQPRDYADDAYETVRRIVFGHGHICCQRAFLDLVRKNRSDYSAVSQYVNDYQEAYTLAKQLKCAITPYCALLQLLKELESDRPQWTAIVKFQLPDDAATDLTESQFFDYCTDAMKRGDK
ncbi:hypothetical protein BO94DRAFT_429977, partial [Aspergillus sclerotioniger CBS 115572]